jgi:hypothetical protein
MRDAAKVDDDVRFAPKRLEPFAKPFLGIEVVLAAERYRGYCHFSILPTKRETTVAPNRRPLFLKCSAGEGAPP